MASFGAVEGPPAGVISRRSFMRRVLGTGVGILSLEFIGGSLAFLWPNLKEGLGATFRLGTLADIESANPGWFMGHPYSFTQANSFIINVPAARALAQGEATEVNNPALADILALWRKCPHLGCQIPPTCEERHRFECRCHGSTFNILGEKLIRGPAPRGMDRFAVEFDQDVLTVDTSQVIAGPPAGSVQFHDPHPADEGCA